MHHETARRFIDDLDQGKYGTTPEDRASALTVLLMAAAAGARAAAKDEEADQ